MEPAATAADQSQEEAVRTTLPTVRHAEEIGLHRVRFAEHHAMQGLASLAPDARIPVLIGSGRPGKRCPAPA
ncbi:hypothetical protein [Streptomyces sp. NPDC088725]|uniref:hypothetical protein n=1 Tax=Streptomyces sp. NPDC088725 TaxID=3365873 RepID=UPI00381D1505